MTLDARCSGEVLNNWRCQQWENGVLTMDDHMSALMEAGLSKRQAAKALRKIGNDRKSFRATWFPGVYVPSTTYNGPGVLAHCGGTLFIFAKGMWLGLLDGKVRLAQSPGFALMGDVKRVYGESVVRLGVLTDQGERVLVADADRDEIAELGSILGIDADRALADFDEQDGLLQAEEDKEKRRRDEMRQEAERLRSDPEVQERAARLRALITAEATISHMLDGAEALVRVVAQKEGEQRYPLESAAIWLTMPLVFTIPNFRRLEAHDAAWLFESLSGLLPEMESLDNALNVVDTATDLPTDKEAVRELTRTFNEQAVIARSAGDAELASILADFSEFAHLMQRPWPEVGDTLAVMGDER